MLPLPVVLLLLLENYSALAAGSKLEVRRSKINRIHVNCISPECVILPNWLDCHISTTLLDSLMPRSVEAAAAAAMEIEEPGASCHAACARSGWRWWPRAASSRPANVTIIHPGNCLQHCRCIMNAQRRTWLKGRKLSTVQSLLKCETCAIPAFFSSARHSTSDEKKTE